MTVPDPTSGDARPTTLAALLRGSAIYALGSVLPRLGFYLLLPIYTIGMGAAGFGTFSLMVSLAGLLAIAFRLGLDGALLRLHFDVPPARRAALYWTTVAMTGGAVAVLAVGIVLLGGGPFASIFPGVPLAPTGLLALGVGAVTALQFVPATYYRALERPGRVLLVGVGTFVVGAIVTVPLVLGARLGAPAGLLGQIAGGLVAILVLALILLRLGPPSFDRTLARQSLAFGLPLIPHALAGWVLNLSDRWLIGLLIGLEAVAAQRAVGVYSLGYQLGQVVAVVALALNTAWVPFFYARGGSSSGPHLLREMTTLSIGAMAALTVLVSAVAPDVVAIIAPASWGTEATTAALVTPLVAVACLLQALYLMAVSPVFLQRRTRVLPLLTITAGAVNVGVNVLLIPVLGILGAAWATVAGYAVLAIATIAYARRGYPLDLDVARLAAIGLGVIGMLTVTRIPTGLAPVPDGLLHVLMAAAFGLASVPVLASPWRRARHLVWAGGRTGSEGPA